MSGFNTIPGATVEKAKAPTIITERKRAPATGARFLPGRDSQATNYEPEKVLFYGVPFYKKVMQEDGSAVAGVPFGPGMELDAAPETGQLDRFKLEGGSKLILAGANDKSETVKPKSIAIGDKKRREQIFQFAIQKVGANVFVLPEQPGKFVWEVWSGFYSRDEATMTRARMLMQAGKFLHGAGPFQGAGYVPAEAQSTTGLIKKIGGLAEGLAQEVNYKLGMVEGIPLWQAYYFVAEYSSKNSQAVLVRQLHQAHLLLCPGGVPQVRSYAAEQMAHSYNDAGVPIPARVAA